MPRESTRVTLVHVADKAGVSLSTASLAFSEGKPITPATRERVLTAAKALGYAGPDPRGRSLRSGRTGIVGVQIDDSVRRAFRDPVVIGILEGVTAALTATSTSVLLIPDTLDDDRLRTSPVDGVVAAGCSDQLPRLRAAMAHRGVPVITAGNQVDDEGCVGVENRAATARLARHLYGLGHRRIAVVRLPRGRVEEARTAGARDVFPDAVLVDAADSTIDAGRSAEIPVDVTAVIAQSDLLAVGVVQAAEESGLVVPRDLSVAGFDDVRIDGFTGRRLTTVRQHIVEQGRLAAQALLAAIDGAPLPTVALPTELVVGDTTDAPPRESAVDRRRHG
ncbi:LacI family DNA-binding transcriptional regulator [Tsukamurella sp. 8F]|uniref:LacI family DNA-binding transcriptional regulator n=1 Tax=unclassified Tsukamurella TaxID=2633480 RepID=UPI0023B932F5|nr:MULTISPECIES: LacI family DNA-binding transcriptional regulator [unclassified Tsukamurella]MDF0530092.1 LacI family DNA-binding transcriptional regulator [Tsukamurella sp. 8J]MDF0586410.1 LacI family DNA-binding transcriptional regulator [Tsukamurella sp. 8F]